MLIRTEMKCSVPDEAVLEILTSTFFDEDGVECIEVDKATRLFPNRSWGLIEHRFAWDKGCERRAAVMTLQDLLFVLKTGDEWHTYNYDEVHMCSVCRKLLLPDDEAYPVTHAGEEMTVCDEHSAVDEETDGYRLRIFP